MDLCWCLCDFRVSETVCDTRLLDDNNRWLLFWCDFCLYKRKYKYVIPYTSHNTSSRNGKLGGVCRRVVKQEIILGLSERGLSDILQIFLFKTTVYPAQFAH